MSISAAYDAQDVKSIMREERWNQRHARAYDRYRWLSSRQRWRDLLSRELTDVAVGAELFEVGSGTGFITEILVSCGYRVQGIDLSPAMLARASRNLAAAGCMNRVRLSVGDAEALDAPSGQVEAVVSRWVLWTLPQPRRALAEMVRILAPGGVLVCIDGQFQERGTFARWRAALVDMVLTGRLPDWRSPAYSQVKAALPCLDGPEIIAALQKLGLVDLSFRWLPAGETDGKVKNWLMGSAWKSYLVSGRKPK